MQTDIEDRIRELKAMLRARQGKREYRDNVPALEAEIAQLERSLELRNG